MFKRAAFTLVAFGCGPVVDDSAVEGTPEGKTQDAERIDSRNDPNAFRLNMVRRFVDLPTSGESTRKPFPSNWWPMRQGGAAQRWYQGEASPTEKYDLLVGATIRDVSLTLAKKNWKGEPVNANAQPETFRIGPATEWELRHHGRYGDTDPDSWWGHCNGWSSYVLNEDEPVREVWAKMTSGRVEECTTDRSGCVLFRLGDINALGAELYWNDAARMLGRRCEQETSEFQFDASGRINAVECRDGNAAAWHIVAANMLGAMQRPFIIDLNADFQVWNYPVYRFEIDQDDEVTVQEALAEVGAPAGTTTWIYNDQAVRLRKIQMRAWIVSDSIPPSTQPAGGQLDRYTTIETYEYILELDAIGDIIGGEWIGANKTNHADFIWYSYSNDRTSSDDRYDSDNPNLRYSVFDQILTLAQRAPQPPPGGNVLRLSRTPRVAIPDNDPTGASDTIDVTESFAATSVAVAVDVTHTYQGDLTVLLSHGGQQFTLRSTSGGSTPNIHETYTVAAAIGMSAGGDWTLRVVDSANADVGTIDQWTLTLGRPGGGGGGTVSRSYDATPALPIPDNNRTGISHAISIGDNLRIDELRVTVDVTHTYIGDLSITLSNGTASQTIHDRAGGNTRNLHQTFPTSAFKNASARGTWTLKIADTAAIDTGTLDAWAIEVSGTQL
jgi:subtilisin-like proprotein convertase family protein